MSAAQCISVLVLAVSCATGCAAVPFISPPVSTSVGVGGRTMKAAGVPRTYDAPIQLRSGVNLLGLFRELGARRGDGSVGYFADFAERGTVQGGFLEGSGVVLQHGVGSGLGKLSVRAQARLLKLAPENAWGHGASLGVSWEFVAFADDDFHTLNGDGGIIGHAYGEGGVGVLLEGSYLKAGTVTGWAGSLSLITRIPASYGIAFAWIWALLK